MSKPGGAATHIVRAVHDTHMFLGCFFVSWCFLEKGVVGLVTWGTLPRQAHAGQCFRPKPTIPALSTKKMPTGLREDDERLLTGRSTDTQWPVTNSNTLPTTFPCTSIASHRDKALEN